MTFIGSSSFFQMMAPTRDKVTSLTFFAWWWARPITQPMYCFKVSMSLTCVGILISPLVKEVSADQGNGHNVCVDAAARIKPPFAAPSKLRNTLPPLASNDLFDSVIVLKALFRCQSSTISHDTSASIRDPQVHRVDCKCCAVRSSCRDYRIRKYICATDHDLFP